MFGKCAPSTGGEGAVLLIGAICARQGEGGLRSNTVIYLSLSLSLLYWSFGLVLTVNAFAKLKIKKDTEISAFIFYVFLLCNKY